MPVAILKNMNVDESNRGQGIGSSLLSDFEDEAIDKRAWSILLIADHGEIQTDGFYETHPGGLASWYQSYGFKTIGDAGGNPVMIMTLQRGLEEL